MTTVTPLDLLIAAVLSVRRFGFGRTVLAAFLLTPVYLWSLPPVSCGCLGPLFRRCAYGNVYLAAMKSDLKNLASQEEIYFSDQDTYTADFDAMGFVASNGVRVTVVAGPEGWAAVARHDALPDARSCSIFYGRSPGPESELAEAGERPGAPVCAE